VFHYTKSFGTFARAYGIQEGSGLPEVYPGVVPVSIVDDAQAYVKPTYPYYTVRGTRAAVAAVYSVVGLFCPANGNPFRIRAAVGEGNSSIMFRLAVVDIRTANTTAITPAGLVRGSTLTTQCLGGTTTVDPASVASDLMFYLSALYPQVGQGVYELVVRPGEYLWFSGLTVNKSTTVSLCFEELLFTLGPNPTAL